MIDHLFSYEFRQSNNGTTHFQDCRLKQRIGTWKAGTQFKGIDIDWEMGTIQFLDAEAEVIGCETLRCFVEESFQVDLASSEKATLHIRRRLSWEGFLSGMDLEKAPHKFTHVPEVYKDILKIPGLHDLFAGPYYLQLYKGRVFSWDEIIPQVTELVDACQQDQVVQR